MPISGPSDKNAEFIASLDENKFVDCVRDILATKGHSDLKVMDGPGDGCRDIHSLDPEGKKHLTQCKFHGKKEKTVSSREIGELPLGMVKLGYLKGLFCTNAKISPQSKREFIDNYPDLLLDFWEGSQIPNEVFSNMVLRSIWFNGKSIDLVSYLVTIQALARDLVSNKPIDLSRAISGEPSKMSLTIDDVEVDVTFRESSLIFSNFEPYLPPEKRTIKEGWGWGLCAEIVISGPIPIDRILKVQHEMAEVMIARIVENMELKTQHFALRLGTPQLAPLAGGAAGTRIALDYDPLTIVRHHDKVTSESEWILPKTDAGWFPPRVMQASYANWARWYHPGLDLCLDLKIISKPSQFFIGTIEEQYTFFQKWWNESLFALLAKSKVSEFETKGIQKPTELFEWFEDQVLCSWQHGNLSSGLRSMLIEPDDNDENQELHQHIFEVDSLEYKISYKKIKLQLESLDATIITPSKARHMIAVVSEDPFPNQNLMEYRSVDLMYTFGKIPSPISPSSRCATITIGWLLNKKDKLNPDDILYDEIEKLVIKATQKWTIASIVFDDKTLSGKYLVIYLDRSFPFGIESTDKTITEDLIELEPIFNNLNDIIKVQFPSAKRATKQFWNNEIGMDFVTN